MHSTGLDEIVESGDGQIRHAKTRCSGSGTRLVQAIEASLQGTACADTVANTGSDLGGTISCVAKTVV